MDAKMSLKMMRFLIFVKFAFLSAILTFSFEGFAQMTEVVSYQGSGCPEGSLSAAISPNGLALSLIYDQFSAEGHIDSGRVARKSCSINVKLNIPKGYRLASVKLDQRGFASMPEASYGILSTIIQVYDTYPGNIQFFGKQKTYGQGPFQDNFTLSQVLKNRVANKNCQGGTQQMLVTTNMSVVVTDQSTEGAQASLDSTDVTIDDPNANAVKISLEKCTSRAAIPLNNSGH